MPDPEKGADEVKREIVKDVLGFVLDPKMMGGGGLGIVIVGIHLFMGNSQTLMLLRQIQRNVVEVKVDMGAIIDAQSPSQKAKTKELISERMAAVRMAIDDAGTQGNP